MIAKNIPSVNFEEPGFVVGVKQKIKAIEFVAVMTVTDKLLHCLHGLDNTPLDVKEGLISLFNPNSRITQKLLA